MKALLVVLGLLLGSWGIVELGVAWSTVWIGAGLVLLALIVAAAADVGGRALAKRRARAGWPAKAPLSGWKRRAVGVVQVCAMVAPSAILGTFLYVHHQQSCRIPRTDAARQVAVEQNAFRQSNDDIKDLVHGNQSKFEQDLHDRGQAGLAYAAIVFGNKGCFNSVQVAAAGAAAQAYARPADDATTPNLYCWDTGPLRPHHLGHRVFGDHPCTYGELRSIGLFR